jgi:malate dehydrogenase (oxaloacetate-decarboxylating)(NADP+)
VDGADIFLGLSAGGVLKPEMVATMAPKPIILALANPYPEILPEDAKAVRPDAIIATGRSGLSEPGQQRAVLPVHLPRRAGRGRDRINEAMKLACVRAIAALARKRGLRPGQRLRRANAEASAPNT